MIICIFQKWREGQLEAGDDGNKKTVRGWCGGQARETHRQGGVPGTAHFALKLNLLAQVDKLLCPPHPLHIAVAVPDQLRRDQGKEREDHCVRVLSFKAHEGHLERCLQTSVFSNKLEETASKSCFRLLKFSTWYEGAHWDKGLWYWKHRC